MMLQQSCPACDLTGMFVESRGAQVCSRGDVFQLAVAVCLACGHRVDGEIVTGPEGDAHFLSLYRRAAT